MVFGYLLSLGELKKVCRPAPPSELAGTFPGNSPRTLAPLHDGLTSRRADTTQVLDFNHKLASFVLGLFQWAEEVIDDIIAEAYSHTLAHIDRVAVMNARPNARLFNLRRGIGKAAKGPGECFT